MRALITGAGGQVGRAWTRAARPGWEISALTRSQLDVGDETATAEAVEALRPDVIVNAAAFTAVDLAQSEQAAAWRANRDGARNLARAAQRCGARLAHISTDFVFDGRSARPYRPGDPTAPLSVYGASKRAGEEAVSEVLPQALIVRTGWVYGGQGANFLTTMLRLMNQDGSVRVVDDQIGTPTSAASLAEGLWRLIEFGAEGLYHYTDAGVASWYDFAQAIAEEASAAGRAPVAARVMPINTSDFPTAAPRPAFSVLDKSETWNLLGGPAPHWRAALRAVLAGMES
jgi:dTDP-4-dehydrorhamnose reductase